MVHRSGIYLFTIFVAATMLVPHEAKAAAIDIWECSNECGMYGGYIEINGEIIPGDLAELQRQFSAKPDVGLGYAVALNSAGGSVSEAMALGRWVRAHSLVVFVPRESTCASACVFVLAAGLGKFPTGNVRIHRPYFTEMPSEPMNIAIRDLLTAVRSYLEEMNIPPSLADAMFSIPPEETYQLTEADLRRYRLDLPDLVWTEETQLQAAIRAEVPRTEYLARLGRMKASGEMDECLSLPDTGELVACASVVRLNYGLEKLKPSAPPSKKKIIVDRCSGEIITDPSDLPPCSAEDHWVRVTVPDFLKQHPRYEEGNAFYQALDEEVRRLQLRRDDQFDPEILIEAHRNLLARH